MRDTELKRRKAEAIYCVYKKGLEEGRFSSMREAGEWVRVQPAPCYFISAEKASEQVGMILSGVSLMDLNDSQRRKIWRLYKEYKNFLAEHPGTKLSRDRIMESIVDRPAPEFYMTAEGIRKVLRTHIKEVRRKRGW